MYKCQVWNNLAISRVFYIKSIENIEDIAYDFAAKMLKKNNDSSEDFKIWVLSSVGYQYEKTNEEEL